MNPAFLSLCVPFMFLIAAFIIAIYFTKEVPLALRVDSSAGMMRRMAKFLSFFAALFFTAMTFIPYSVKEFQPGRDYLILFDITRSMMVKDVQGLARLDAAKRMALQEIRAMPDTARVAIGAYSGATYNSNNIKLLLPLAPVSEIGAFRETLEIVDWWNAWESGSTLRYIPQDVYEIVKNWKKPLNIIVFSDGDESAEVPLWSVPPADLSKELEWKHSFASTTNFLFIGVGEAVASDVPKFDEHGKEIGCFGSYYCMRSALDEEKFEQLVNVLNQNEITALYFRITAAREIHQWVASKAIAGPRRLIIREGSTHRWSISALLALLVWIFL